MTTMIGITRLAAIAPIFQIILYRHSRLSLTPVSRDIRLSPSKIPLHGEGPGFQQRRNGCRTPSMDLPLPQQHPRPRASQKIDSKCFTIALFCFKLILQWFTNCRTLDNHLIYYVILNGTEVWALHVTGEAKNDAIRPGFNKSIFIDFAGAKITSDAGFLLMREVD